MKLTILVDNNTLIDRYFIGEPGLSFYIEDSDTKILFDSGYSDAFIKNASKLDINLLDLDYIVISHGHLDHTWGLTHLIRRYTEAKIEKREFKIPTLIAHPDAFLYKEYENDEEIGSILSENKLSKYFHMSLSKKPISITDNLFFLGEIEKINDFEALTPIGTYEKNGVKTDDYVLDDSALVYKSNDGLVIITGCSHSGICNIVDYAKKVCNDSKVIDIIGGFHLLNTTDKQLSKTIEHLKDSNIKSIHACHCTDLQAKIALSKISKLQEVGVGLDIKYI